MREMPAVNTDYENDSTTDTNHTTASAAAACEAPMAAVEKANDFQLSWLPSDVATASAPTAITSAASASVPGSPVLVVRFPSARHAVLRALVVYLYTDRVCV
jgi:hypothetical protein